jgi:hypothetical protein
MEAYFTWYPGGCSVSERSERTIQHSAFAKRPTERSEGVR